MAQIRVLQIMGKIVGGGVESIILNYYTHIDHVKFCFDFVVDGHPLPYFEEAVQKFGGRVYKVTPYDKNVFQYMEEVYHIIKRWNYDIVHSNMNTVSEFPLFAAKMAGAKIRILHNHATANSGEGIKTILKYVLRPFAKLFATNYCACSENAARWMYGSNWKRRCHIIYNAIDLNAFCFDADIRQAFRKKLRCDDSQLVVGHVGRMEYAKNQSFLLDVFSDLLKNIPHAVLLILGDGSLKPMLMKKATDLGIKEAVRFLGVQSNVNQWMQAMDVFVFPSWYEGLGMAAIEAQAAGLPVIASKYVPEEAAVTDRILFKGIEDGAEDWSDSICSLDINTNLRTQIHISQRYNILHEYESLQEYYEKLVQESERIS